MECTHKTWVEIRELSQFRTEEEGRAEGYEENYLPMIGGGFHVQYKEMGKLVICPNCGERRELWEKRGMIKLDDES